MVISRTPFRVSFFGGGTDYPAWYREHGGAVVATTIDKYCYLTCRALPPFFDAVGLIVKQYEAPSKDGTKVPYFLVMREDAKFDGQIPTLLLEDGQVLTESAALLIRLGMAYPASGLLPTEPTQCIRGLGMGRKPCRSNPEEDAGNE